MKNGRNAVLAGASLLAIGAVVAFMVGQQTFSAVNGAPAIDSDAQILAQTVVESMAGRDSDGDGLTDLEEVRYRTDPNDTDSDHDGYSDGTEVTNGYDPTSPAGDVDQSQPVASTNTQASLLGQLGLAPIGGEVDGLNVGGLGGLPAGEAEQLSGKAVTSTERLAELEVDKILAATSQALPAVDPAGVTVDKGTNHSDAEAYASEAFSVVANANPFSEDYRIATFLDDVSSGNRDQVERLKVALEVMDRELSKLHVPEQALTAHLHALSIARGGAQAAEQFLSTQGDPDAMLTFIGRTVFLWNEIRALLKEVDLMLNQ